MSAPKIKEKRTFCGICGYEPGECVCARVMAREVCGIRAAGGMIGYAACEEAWGHEGTMHVSGGDGFYSRVTEDEHRWRQKARGAVEDES